MVNEERLARVVTALGDEAASDEIESLVEASRGVDFVAASRSGREALEILAREPVDLLICSARLPDLDGFELLAAAGERGRPRSVVYLSNADRDAVRAFEAGAVDFVRVPASPERLALAMRRGLAVAARRNGNGHAPVEPAVRGENGAPPEGTPFLQRLVARSGQRWVVVPTGSIRWIEARGKYLRLHCGDESYRLRSTVQEVFAQLDPARFFRVHRSTIVQLDEVREFASTRQGDCRVRLRDGAEVLLTRDRRRSFLAALAGAATALPTA